MRKEQEALGSVSLAAATLIFTQEKKIDKEFTTLGTSLVTLVAENPPANARGVGSIPGLRGRHMLQGAKPMCHDY